MYRVFNCGIGMVVIVAPEFADIALSLLRSAGETAWHIGIIRPCHARSAQTIIE
jgi:phosphoribosylformylglycinamidine cyclo-ligase